MDERGANTDPLALGSRVSFSGRLNTNETEVGKGLGSCTVVDASSTSFLSMCTIFLTYTLDGEKGVLAMTGSTDEVGGLLQVTGTGGDLLSKDGGAADLVFDPDDLPLIYLSIVMT